NFLQKFIYFILIFIFLEYFFAYNFIHSFRFFFFCMGTQHQNFKSHDLIAESDFDDIADIEYRARFSGAAVNCDASFITDFLRKRTSLYNALYFQIFIEPHYYHPFLPLVPIRDPYHELYSSSTSELYPHTLFHILSFLFYLHLFWPASTHGPDLPYLQPPHRRTHVDDVSRLFGSYLKEHQGN